MNNNPTNLGVHESKLLWPCESFQCILSLGTGRYDPYQSNKGPWTSSWATLSGLPRGLVESATNTESMFALKDVPFLHLVK